MSKLWWHVQNRLRSLPLPGLRSREQHEFARNLELHLEMHDELDRRRNDSESSPKGRLGNLKITEIHIDDKKATPWEKLGPAQRESLLAFIVSTDIEDAMAHAEGDNIVYDALGEHRILGKSRKKKGRILPAAPKSK